ncbi:SDR family NAD(P)-dependent oxidoreductase [Oryzicola mucosus]|uniref:SDR family oxidoreductase n=1 Tax=Oryzicola mucosus TaxID=2767425 RepID=A0A8J6U3U0_9HYPH|nr:SDR family NAD(P)-dependent oxidoreductase [Oryzicola mucosus]MBD0417343.1 SDR family oxidoreductase [Oryzicola mucosus]
MTHIADSLFDLSGLNALVTGSSRGIGRAIADRFVQHGARVIISSRKEDACAATAAEINARRRVEAAIPIAANVSRREDLEHLYAKSVEGLGQIDIVVCNAAIHPYVGPAMGTSDEAMRKVIDANVMGNHWLIQQALPGMIERGFGRIVLIASIAGHFGSDKFYSYSITKAADMQMGRALAAEHGRNGIRVNTVAPGTILTDMARGMTENKEFMDAEMRRNTVQRLGDPDEIAGVVVMLASPAGAYINGQVINVDGGYTISF